MWAMALREWMMGVGRRENSGGGGEFCPAELGGGESELVTDDWIWIATTEPCFGLQKELTE